MRHRFNLSNFKCILGTGALATGLLLFAGAPGARADGCQDRLVHADHKLHEAIEHHGRESNQAEHWRHELHEARGPVFRERAFAIAAASGNRLGGTRAGKSCSGAANAK